MPEQEVTIQFGDVFDIAGNLPEKGLFARNEDRFVVTDVDTFNNGGDEISVGYITGDGDDLKISLGGSESIGRLRWNLRAGSLTLEEIIHGMIYRFSKAPRIDIKELERVARMDLEPASQKPPRTIRVPL